MLQTYYLLNKTYKKVVTKVQHIDIVWPCGKTKKGALTRKLAHLFYLTEFLKFLRHRKMKCTINNLINNHGYNTIQFILYLSTYKNLVNKKFSRNSTPKRAQRSNEEHGAKW